MTDKTNLDTVYTLFCQWSQLSELDPLHSLRIFDDQSGRIDDCCDELIYEFLNFRELELWLIENISAKTGTPLS